MSIEAGRLALLAIIGALIFVTGWAVEGWRKDAEIAELKRNHAEQSASAATAASARLQASIKHGEALQLRVAEQENARQAITEEKDRELKRLTTGRPCLNAGTVRLLNRGPGFKPAAVPAPTGEPVSADAGFATDADVGIWANAARRSYDTCRGRLAALADFYQDQESAR